MLGTHLVLYELQLMNANPKYIGFLNLLSVLAPVSLLTHMGPTECKGSSESHMITL